MKKVIVTGGNRGIGLQICKDLVAAGCDVILTARNAESGIQKAHEIGARFMELDVSKETSIQSFLEKVLQEESHVDVLINNAGIYIDGEQRAIEADFDIVHQTMETNVYGPWRLINGLLPLLKKSNDPRVVNISSGLGAMSEMGSGYPAYRMSKVALNALTRIVASDLGGEVKVNTMCPGWVRTDMGGSNASRSVEHGAETAVWLTLEKNIPNGKFLRDMKVIDW